jgi:hypothetical protein
MIGVYLTICTIGMSIVNTITCPRIAVIRELGMKRIEEGTYQGQHPRKSEI